MDKKTKVVSLIVGIFLLFCATAVSAEEFSADMISTSKEGTFKGKVYVSNNKSRMETAESITISRMDKKVVWILMPDDRMYMEQPLDPRQAAATSEKVDGQIERTLVGKEKIEGKMAEKYQVVSVSGDKKTTLLQWVVPGLKIPVKTAAVDNSWSMEYKNIKTGRQPESLFEVPADYRKFSLTKPSMKDIIKGLL